MPPRWHNVFVSRSQAGSDSSVSDGSSDESIDTHDLDLGIDNVTHYASRVRFNAPRISLKQLRERELNENFPSHQLRSSILRTLNPWRSWTGASKDVLSVAWGPDDSFAIGASTDHAHDRDIPYNKPNNLLYGQLSGGQSTLKHLSGHSHRREDADDLYLTVSHVLFSYHHRTLYSASYDKTVKIWDLPTSTGGKPQCRHTLRHRAKVDLLGQMLTSSAEQPQVLATAQQSRSKPICIYGLTGGEEAVHEKVKPFTCLTSERCSQFKLFPSSLQWGPDPQNREYLLVGFSQHNQPGQDDRSNREGHLLLWNVTGDSDPIELRTTNENVFDVAWAPGRRVIAAGTTPRNARKLSHFHDTRTVVRTWSFEETSDRVAELECPAADINEVKFHPTNTNLLTASCTDGRIYVWDFRKESELLMVLQHGDCIEELDSGRPTEETDTGVRFTTWDKDGRFLYTGSSDGRVACWDINVSPVDALVQEVAHFDSGVMSGSFNADGTKLLCGTVKGSVEILSVGASTDDEVELEAEDGVVPLVAKTERPGIFDEMPSLDDASDDGQCFEGLEAAREYLQSGQLVFNEKFGIGQGPNYQGPYDMASRVRGGSVDVKFFFPDVLANQFDKELREAAKRNKCTTSKMSKQCRRDATKIAAQTVARRLNALAVPSTARLKRTRAREPEDSKDFLDLKRSRTSTPHATLSPTTVQLPSPPLLPLSDDANPVKKEAILKASPSDRTCRSDLNTPPLPTLSPTKGRRLKLTPRRKGLNGFIIPPRLIKVESGDEL